VSEGGGSQLFGFNRFVPAVTCSAVQCSQWFLPDPGPGPGARGKLVCSLFFFFYSAQSDGMGDYVGI
jgi:hypothetical protein